MEFKDRKGRFLNRKKLKVISQTPTEIIVDVERYDEPTEEGTKIDAGVFNAFQNQISQANSTASQASTIAVSARETATDANPKSDDAVAKSTQAVSDSTQAVATANESNIKSNNAVETSNTALQNSQNAVQSANAAVQTSNNANVLANNALANSEVATSTATEAKDKSETANTTANNADAKSTTALTNSEKAIADSEFAKAKSLEVESKLADRGAAVIVGTEAQTSVTFKSDPQTQLDNKLEKSFIGYSQKQTLSNDDLIVVQDSQSNENLKVTMKTLTAAVMNASFPIGAVYISVSPTNPSTLFGGVWEEFAQGRTLIGTGTSDAAFTAGTTGGESSHRLSEVEMPSHTHTQNAHVHENSVWTDAHEHSGAVYTRTSKAGISNDYGSNGDHVCGQINGAKTWKDGWAKANASGVAAHISNVSTTATNNNTGGNASHNNLPPYIVTYMWKRIS